MIYRDLVGPGTIILERECGLLSRHAIRHVCSECWVMIEPSSRCDCGCKKVIFVNSHPEGCATTLAREASEFAESMR